MIFEFWIAFTAICSIIAIVLLFVFASTVVRWIREK